MTATLFDYPQNAAFGRVLPKNKIYEHANLSNAVKEMFVRQVEQIFWQYKLAPETLNIRSSQAVPEIQVFRISLKTGKLKNDVLRCIDLAIPYPILFELNYDEKIKAIAAYKRPSEADRSKWVVSEYFETGWMPADMKRKPLPVILNMEALYSQLLAPLMPYPAHAGESLPALAERMAQIRSKERELNKCEARLRKEKQFNRKVEINAELRALKQELENLTRPSAVVAS